MKTPDEIKKGLEICAGFGGCAACPYDEENLHSCVSLEEDALAYIRELEARLVEANKTSEYEKPLPEPPIGGSYNVK